MRRLSRAGFKKDFVRSAILPDWWDDNMAQDNDLLPELEIRVARFLGLPLSTLRAPGVRMACPEYPNARLRRVREIDRNRLTPAIHSALRIASAVVRCMRGSTNAPQIPPADGCAWRRQIIPGREAVTLDDILDNLWERCIPVVPLDVLPDPNFQGLACIVEGRPVILLGHKHDEPGRVAYFIAHEVGHIAAGDCSAGQPVLDEVEEVHDEDDMERAADRFAAHVLVGGGSIPEVDGSDFRQIARSAAEIERSTGIDAGAIIFEWARRTDDYLKATLAVKALYRGAGARRKLREHFDQNVDLNVATESDRALLRCVYGDTERNAPAD
jgi:Zn-dependent peptidase ImmA (M78 family)